MRQTLILLAGIFAFISSPITLASAQSTQEEFGKCGYYADALHGRKTTSGEPYDKTQFTCAHKSLPFGTNLKVTRLDTKKSVIVRVNDRGPFMDGYVVDLSRTAAEKIGLIREGVTKVKIEVVNDPAPASVQPLAYSAPTKTLPAHLEPVSYSSSSRVSSASDATTQLVKPARQTQGTSVVPATYSTVQGPQAAPAKPGKATAQVSELYQIELKPVKSRGFGLQMAVLTDSENLFQQIEKIQKIWPGKVIVNHEESALAATYKLILGPFATKKEAEAQQKKAATKGYKKTFVVEFE